VEELHAFVFVAFATQGNAPACRGSGEGLATTEPASKAQATTTHAPADIEARLLGLVQRYLAARQCEATPERSLAWDRFYATYDPVIQRIARKSRRHRNDADDLDQEIWKELIAALPLLRLDPARGGLSQWVTGVAVRVRALARRRDKPTIGDCREIEFLDRLVDPASVDRPDTGRARRRELAVQIVEKHAATLQEPNRSIVIAHWIDGRSAPRIAREFYLAEDRVESVLRRERPALLKLLARECIDP
jgi:RNA polymerase sigma factor (sigma-70 family)